MVPSLISVKDLAQWLQIKPTTLYAWAARGKIPSIKIHGLIRFEVEEIRRWLESFMKKEAPPLSKDFGQSPQQDIETLIARVKRDVYTPRHGETRPTASPEGKEDEDGAR